jgi:glycine cleavage system protein P-like pyridoxal-binding family
LFFFSVRCCLNTGSQGEYAGLLAIRKYQQSQGEGHRNICLIPVSAHGTNPASATIAGLQVVVVKCDENGNVDLADLKVKAEEHKKNLSCIMVTYPSTHGKSDALYSSYASHIILTSLSDSTRSLARSLSLLSSIFIE